MNQNTNKIIYILIGAIAFILIIIGILFWYYPKNINLNLNQPANLNAIILAPGVLEDNINYLKNELGQEKYNYIRSEDDILAELKNDQKNLETLNLLDKNKDPRLQEINTLISKKVVENLLGYQVVLEKYLESLDCLAINNPDVCKEIDKYDDKTGKFDFYRQVCQNYHWGYQAVLKHDTTLLDNYSSAEFPNDKEYKGIYLAFSKNDKNLCPKTGGDKFFCEGVIDQDYEAWQKAILAKGNDTERECMLAKRINFNITCDKNMTLDTMSEDYKSLLKDIWTAGIISWQAIMQNNISLCDGIQDNFFVKNICLAAFNKPEKCLNSKNEMEQLLSKYYY